MPYNLRKRKAPEQEPEAPKKEPEPPKRARKQTKEPAKKPKEPPKKAKKEVEKPVVEEEEAKKEAKKEEANKEEAKKEEPKKEKSRKEEIKKEETKEEEARKEEAEKEDDGRLQRQFVFGADSCGELGLGRIGVMKKTPVQVPLADITDFACGPMHTISINKSGEVYSYGCNDEGALGRITDGDEELESTPAKVPINGAVIKVTAGDSHSAALTDKNDVYIWGNFRDEHGSVGLLPECDGKASFQPIRLMPDTKFKDIASGSNHMLLLDTSGVVYSFGVGAQGQLGRIGPQELEGEEKEMDRELFLRPQSVSMKNVDKDRPFVCDAIFAGNFSSFATNTDKKKNRLAAWGLNNYYQLGYKGVKNQTVQHFPRRSTFTCSTSMINVACGQHHTLFLTRTGRVYAAGRNGYGMLGVGKISGGEVCPAKNVGGFDENVVSISAGINSSFAVDSIGQLYSWGMNGPSLGIAGEEDLYHPQKVESLQGKHVKAVSTGGSFTAVLV